MVKKLVVFLVIAGALGAGAWWFFFRTDAATAPSYRIVQIERGDLVQTVRATGIVRPVKLVQVGTQVNGPVRKLYVDFNDRVTEGQLVAQIDPIVYEARLAQDEATLQERLANVEETKARLAQAEKELERSRTLAKREMVPQEELDTAIAGRDALAAQSKVAEASIEQSRASLRLSKANLEYTRIRSPVDGVIVDRNVDEGQTVVASMSAQVLFKIAADLQHIQVEASIPEADIGRIREGQTVTFTVDAHDRTFTGRVSQVRLAATTVQNVVTYPVVILAENPDGKLFPGMTANLVCEVARRDDVLKVPNAALRFTPEGAAAPSDAPAGARPAASAASNSSSVAAAPSPEGPGRRWSGTRSPGGRPDGRTGDGTGRSSSARSRVWIPGTNGAPPAAVEVRTGISDAGFTELVEAGALKDGDGVIGGIALSTGGQDTVNPFAPPRPPGGARRAMR